MFGALSKWQAWVDETNIGLRECASVEAPWLPDARAPNGPEVLEREIALQRRQGHMPLTSAESQRIIKMIATAYTDLFVRQQALTVRLAWDRGIPIEQLEADLQAWLDENYETVAKDAQTRLNDLLTAALRQPGSTPPRPPR